MIEPMSFREENFSCFKKIANTVVKIGEIEMSKEAFVADVYLTVSINNV